MSVCSPYVGLSSKTLGEVIRNLTRYVAVLNDAVRIELQLQDDPAIVAFDVIDATVRSRRQVTEFRPSANLIRGLRFITRLNLRARRGGVPSPAEPRDRLPSNGFFGCPVRFGQPALHGFLSPGSQLDIPIATADHRLLAVLTGYCQEVLADRQPVSSGLRHEVERVLMKPDAARRGRQPRAVSARVGA